MVSKTITPEQEKKIVRYLKTHSQHATAKHFKISPSTVNRISKEHPTAQPFAECSEPKRATQAHKAHAKADRLNLLHKFTGLVDQAMNSGDLSTGDLKNISTALGTLLDKYRLEEKDTDDKSKGEIIDLFNRMKGADAPAA